jgi:Ca-activated chloride channel family protein
MTGSGPRHIIYVLDISLSMVTRLKRARQEVHDALATLQPEESFSIIAFSNDITVFRSALVPATPANVEQANTFLDDLRFQDGTNLEKALRAALAQPGVNLVVVITDGVPTQGQRNWKKLTRLVRSLNRSKARIFTIGLVGLDPFGKDRTFEAARLLQQISQDSNGEFKVFPLD